MKRAAVLLLGLAACHPAWTLSPEVLQKLQAVPGAYLSGEVTGLERVALLDNRDFSYAIAASPNGEEVAFTHLGARTFQLGLWTVDPPRQLGNPDLNRTEFDVEAVDFSPDGQAVVTAGRDGAVHAFQADAGVLARSYLTEEPLVSVAVHPGGRYLVAGSARGLLTVLSLPALEFVSEVRAHTAEVRGLAFAADGTLYSGGWDKSIRVFGSAEVPLSARAARVGFDRHGGFAQVRGNVDGKLSVSFAFDERLPYLVVTAEVAKGLGIDVPFLAQTATVATPLGSTVVRLSPGHGLRFKGLEVKDLTLGVCDSCVPPGVQGVLGAAFSERVKVSFDDADQAAVLEAKDPAPNGPEAPARSGLALTPLRKLTFDGYVNDLTLDRPGTHLGVAFSEVKAERNREIYEREKKGLEEPLLPGNVGAVVSVSDGTVLRRGGPHHGVVSSAALSPDGQTLVTGGWDHTVVVQTAGEPLVRDEFGWSIRRVRFSPDGRYLLVAAWTPQNPLGDQQSKPSAVVYRVEYREPRVGAR